MMQAFSGSLARRLYNEPIKNKIRSPAQSPGRSPPAGEQIRIQQVCGEPAELTTEIVRLLIADPHRVGLYRAQGVGLEDMAAYQFACLAEPGTAVFVAESGKRLSGLLALAPDIQSSAWLARHVWSVKRLIVAPEAPAGTAAALVERAVSSLAGQIECLTARVPATDGPVISGLRSQGFQITGCEVLSVVNCDGTAAWQPPSVTFAAFEPRHVHAAAALLLNSTKTDSRLPGPGIQSSRLAGYYAFLLMGIAREPHSGGIVAQGSSGQLLGLVTFTRMDWMRDYTHRRLASLDFFVMHPRVQNNGLGEMLLRQVLSRLAGWSVDAVTVKTNMNGSNPDSSLRNLRKLGGRPGLSSLVMCRWRGKA